MWCQLIANGAGFAAILTLLLAAAGCGRTEQQAPPREPGRVDSVVAGTEFHAPVIAPPARLDTIIAIDLVPGGKPEYVVASIRPDSARPRTALADRLAFYRYDSSARAYTLALADSMLWAVRFETRDVTGDGAPDLVVFTDGAGTDAIATRGMIVYAASNGSIGRPLRLDHGRPAFGSAAPDGETTIFVYNELWPAFASHAQAVEYLDDILVYSEGAFASARAAWNAPLLLQADSALARYRRLRPQFRTDTLRPTDSMHAREGAAAAGGRDSVEAMPAGPHPLFTEAALVMISYGRGLRPERVRSFWRAEAEYLRGRIPAEQFAELESIQARMLGPQ
ncbi:MAG: hypothetical protein JST22_09560 [Bacteroidetes bacterium]|nr:hypothetical protein [Bacteroidota bacterium]